MPSTTNEVARSQPAAAQTFQPSATGFDVFTFDRGQYSLPTPR